MPPIKSLLQLVFAPMALLHLTAATGTSPSTGFLRTARRMDETSTGANTTAITTTTSDEATDGGNVQCAPCPVCDAPQQATAKEKIKLRFLVPERSFARLQVMLEQMADDYTRMVSE